MSSAKVNPSFFPFNSFPFSCAILGGYSLEVILGWNGTFALLWLNILNGGLPPAPVWWMKMDPIPVKKEGFMARWTWGGVRAD